MKINLSDSVSDPIISQVYCSRFLFSLPLKILFSYALSVDAGVVGFWCPISNKAVRVEVVFWQFSNKPPNSTSVADAVTFLMMLHSTSTGSFYRVISCIGVLYFGTRKKYLPDLLRASGSGMSDASE